MEIVLYIVVGIVIVVGILFVVTGGASSEMELGTSQKQLYQSYLSFYP